MERRGGVVGNKSPFKIYAGAQIRKENFNGNKEDSGKEDGGVTARQDFIRSLCVFQGKKYGQPVGTTAFRLAVLVSRVFVE